MPDDRRRSRADNRCEDAGQRIQTYYDDEGYNARSRRFHRRSSYPRRDFARLSYNPESEPYGLWGSDDWSEHVDYAQSDHGNYESIWDTSHHTLPEDAHSHDSLSNAQNDYQHPSLTGAPVRSPSPSYLATSLDKSAQSTTAPRKLLILDLNGTLLFRSKPPPPPRGQRNGPLQPLKRTMYPRPYLASFRQYLFHPDTRRWLDVMIWSSAQPHSVQDMLQYCFPIPGEPQNTSSDERFLAVWARDTLGLSTVDYARKVQTTKDLSKPWTQLAPSKNDKFENKHSAHTTVLLDDSPLKAFLQPWNHVCVPEYNAAAHATESPALADRPNGSGSIPSVSAPAAQSVQSSPIDRTLLAVIGILEALQLESNVAAWMRAGGLCSLRGVQEDSVQGDDQQALTDADSKGSEANEMGAGADAQSPAHLDLNRRKHGRDTDDVLEHPPAKRPRGRSPPNDPDGGSSPATPIVSSASHSSPLHPSSAPELMSPTAPAALPTTSTPHVPDHATNHPATPVDTEPLHSSSLWFEHAPTLQHWIANGRTALRVLGIPEVAVDDRS